MITTSKYDSCHMYMYMCVAVTYCTNKDVIARTHTYMSTYTCVHTQVGMQLLQWMYGMIKSPLCE